MADPDYAEAQRARQRKNDKDRRAREKRDPERLEKRRRWAREHARKKHGTPPERIRISGPRETTWRTSCGIHEWRGEPPSRCPLCAAARRANADALEADDGLRWGERSAAGG